VTEKRLTFGVAVCTYRRAGELSRCLAGIAAQRRAPDDIVIVVQTRDRESQEFLAGNFLQQNFPAGPKPRIVSVDQPGTVVARNAALDACRTDVLAMLDDDAVPHPDWLERIAQDFANDPRLGGLGGRDRCFQGHAFDERKAEVVGKLQWWGRRIGNHHLGHGPLRPVDVLKGANMSFRAEAFRTVRFDPRLRGSGAVSYEDIAFSLAVRRAGWGIAYDPAVLVDHYEGVRTEPRYYSYTIPVSDAEAFRNFAFNGVVALWGEMSWPRRGAFLLWSILVGTRVCPGLVQAVRFTRAMGVASWRRFFIAQQGILEGCWSMLRASPPRSIAPSHRAAGPQTEG
jgi:GT2 family glycosyltransferase